MKQGNGGEAELINRLFQKGVLASIKIGWWAGQEQLQPEDLGIPSEQINANLFSLGRKRAIPKFWVGKFRKWEIQAREALRKWSFEYNLGSTSFFVPSNGLPSLLDELNYCKQKYNEVIEEFLAEYPRIKEEMLRLYSEEAISIWNRLPENFKSKTNFETFKKKIVDSIKAIYLDSPRGRFYMDWYFYEITLPKDFKMEAVNAEEKVKKSREEQIKMEEYRNAVKQQVQGFLGEVSSSLRKNTVELFSKVASQVKEGKVTEKRLERVKEFIDRFKVLNFIDDSEVQNHLNNIKKLVDKGDADIFNNNISMKAELEKALSETIKASEIEDLSIVERSFGFGRKVITK